MYFQLLSAQTNNLIIELKWTVISFIESMKKYLLLVYWNRLLSCNAILSTFELTVAGIIMLSFKKIILICLNQQLMLIIEETNF